MTDQSGYTWRWWLNAALVTLSILAVIANVITVVVPNGAWLGLSDTQWHYVLLIATTITALNAAFNRTPQVQNPPSQSRFAVENEVQKVRQAG